MKALFLLLSLLGISLLFTIFLIQKPLEVKSEKDLSPLIDNTLVSVSGLVIKQVPFGSSQLITLDNKIEIICNTCPFSLNKSISATGTVNSFIKKRIDAKAIIPKG